MEEAPQKAETHIAILPTPGMGHLIPLTELAQKLIHQQGFVITFIFPCDGSPNQPQKALLDTFPSINSIFLPLPTSSDDIPVDAPIEARILLTLSRSTPYLRNLLSRLKETARLSALLVDLFGASTLGEFKELGIPLYIFYPSAAMALSFTLHFPMLDQSCTSDYGDLPEPVKFPGCVPINGSDLPDSVHDRKAEVYRSILELCKKFLLADGILVNSFLELEPETFKELKQGRWPPVYNVGPLIRPVSTDEKAECLTWLDGQPAGSVLFVSFGSGGTLSTAQLKELALGLEMSQQRFLLVAKRPDDKVRNAAYFDVGSKSKANPFDYLPSGFIKRTEGKGFVSANWAPQVEVLCHPSVGGFLTHCGWNSILESVVHGVPLIAWPLFAEQRMNAVLLSQGLKVAIRVREGQNGVVDSEQIASVVRRLMGGEEGEKLRKRMQHLKNAARRALNDDGSSTESLASVAQKWKSGIAPH